MAVDIAIVGLSLVCPGAMSVGEFWRNLVAGTDSITDVPEDVIEPLYFTGGDSLRGDRFECKRGGFLSRAILDPLRYGILPVAAEGAEPDHILSLTLTEQALNDAGVFARGISLDNAAMILGQGNFAGYTQLRASEIVRGADELTAIMRHALPGVSDEDWERVRLAYQEQYGRYQGDTVTATMPSLVASWVANHFDMHGPAYTIDAACASGVVALDHASRLLASGECDLAVIGGMHTAQSAVFWSAFTLMGALSRRGVIAPFSQDADGLLIGQGAGMLVVKTLDRAMADDDRIYAVVKGTAVGSDGGGHSVLVTNADGQSRVVKRAWERAGLDPSLVGYVEAHGTGTLVGDATEIETLTRVFGDSSAPGAYLGSVKSNIGHLMPAAGAMGLIKTTLALFHRQIPPTLHAEKPMTVVSKSRFSLPQELVDWEQAGLPLVAGVDAFGFGGVDAHAVLTAFEEPATAKRRYRAARHEHYCPEAYVLGAPTREALLSKLDLRVLKNQLGKMTGEPSDPCRLVLFDPTEDRLRMAADIVRRGQPWLGRNDIWYTEKPLLALGGKVAFVLPSLTGGLSGTEDATLADALDLTRVHHRDDPDRQWYQQAGDHFAIAMSVNEALLKTGITPDVYAGHSIGEWQAARAAGMLDDDFDDLFTDYVLDPANLVGPDDVPDVRIIAATGDLGEETVAAVLAEVPGAILGSDNCPGQKSFCAVGDDVDALMRALSARRIACHVMPFSSGLHTPFVEAAIAKPLRALKSIVVRPGRVPLWSNITLEEVRADGRSAAEVFGPQLSQPVRFRELVQLLYDQGVRVFIQVGLGSAAGFVEDTLAGQEFASVQAISALHDSVRQLRRVHALMFVMGGPADLDFMGLDRIRQTAGSLFLMPNGAPMLTHLDALDSVLEGLVPAGSAAAAAPPQPGTPAVPPAPIPRNRLGLPQRGFTRASPVSWPGMDPTVAPAGLAPAMMSPAPAMMRPGAAPAAMGPAPVAPAVLPQTPAVPKTPAVPASQPPPRRAGTSFEVPIRWTLDDFPYVMDHSIVNQPPGWPHEADLYPVMPLTLTMELLAEIVKVRVPPKMKILQLGPMMAIDFIPINTPFESTLRGLWTSENTVSLKIPGHIQMEITVGPEFPDPPPGTYVEQVRTDIGAPVREPLGREEQYMEYSFHRPRYWPCLESSLFGEHGFVSRIRLAEGKGSLLDHMGGSIGLFLHLYFPDNRVSFPVRVQEVKFYQDISDQAGVFDAYTVVRKVTDSFIIADAVYVRDGRIWAVARNWVNQRVGMDIALWESITHPERTVLSEEIAPGVFTFGAGEWTRASVGFLGIRYLSEEERQRVLSLPGQEAQGDFLAGRIALRDAVRAHLSPAPGDYLYPIQISTTYDEAGKLGVLDETGHPFSPPVEVSLAHRDHIGVAIAAGHPVGVDVERIEAKPESFLDLVFTGTEKALIAGSDNPAEWAIRFWVAKEAYGKMLGTGLSGAPRSLVVDRVEGESLYIGGRRIKTMKVFDRHIAGWTEGSGLHDNN